MDPLLALDIAASVLSACDFVSKIVLALRYLEGDLERLEEERLNLDIEVDRLNELRTAIRDSIQKQICSSQRRRRSSQRRSMMDARSKDLQVLEAAMTETIIATGKVFPPLEQSSPAGGLQRSAMILGPSEWSEIQGRVDKIDECIVSLRRATSSIVESCSKPDRPPDKAPTDCPGRFGRDALDETSQPGLPVEGSSPSELVGAKGCSSRGRGDGRQDSPPYEDISALARFGLVTAVIAGNALISINFSSSFVFESTLEELGLRPVLKPSTISLLHSPAALIFATATTAMALTTYHYLQRGRRHQDACIVGAVAAGVAGGLLYELDGTSILLRVTPWSALLGMLVGAYSPVGKKTSMENERDAWQLSDEQVSVDIKSSA